MTETIRERIARALEPQAWAALGIGDSLACRSRRASSQRKADAILNILSEPGEEDVERVARDLAGRGGFSWGDLGDIPYSVFDDPQGSKRYWLKLARAAIKAYVSGGEG